MNIIKITDDELKQLIHDASKRVLNEMLAKKPNLTEKEYFEGIRDIRQEALAPKYDNNLSLFLPMHKLNEGLVMTYPLDTTIRYVKEYFKLKDWQIYKSNEDKIVVEIANYGESIKYMRLAMDYCGYYLGFPTYENAIQQQGYVTLLFEPKYTNTITDEILKTEEVLFHITPRYNRKKIERFGFSPRSKNMIFDFPNRIYLLRGSAGIENAVNLGRRLYHTNPNKEHRDVYSIFTLDVKQLPNTISLYQDMNLNNGLYTSDYIKPNCISNVVDYNYMEEEEMLKQKKEVK